MTASNDVVAAHRPELFEDAVAIADEYRDEGWTALALQPTLVQPMGPDARGLEVVVPTDEFDRVERAVEADDAEFAATDVYSRLVERVALCLVVVEDRPTETAVVVPLSYDVDDAGPMLEAARDRGQLLTHLRPADDNDRIVTVAHDDPGLFVPGMGTLGE
jgi:hypothetical protein